MIIRAVEGMDILRKGLPRPWSYGVMSDGRVFFINDETHHTTWLHPNTEEPVCSGHQRLPDLPKSWERGVTPDGHPYYIDHNKQETTLVHPVTKESAIPAEPVQAPPQYTSRQEEVVRSSPTTQQNMDAKKSPKKKLSSGNLRSPTVKRSSQAPVTLQGWLWKQGSDGLMRWKKRWFVLSDFCLFYYKGPEEEKTLGSILLPSYKISPCANEGRVLRKFAFKAEHQNMRTYYFAADSKEAMHQWMKAMSLATILQKDSCFGHREDHSEHGERQNIPSSGQDDEDSGFTSYHSRRYPHSPQHDGNSTLNTSFTSDPSRSRPDESYRDTASDTSHVTNEQLNDGYLGSADKYPTSYGSHTHFHRNPALIPNGSKQPLYANAPPKPKRLGNQEPYSPAKGEYAPEEYSGNYPSSNISYPAHPHARREEYNSTGHPHDPRMQQAYLAQEYDDEYPEEYHVSGQPEYDSRYTKEPSSNHQRPGSRRNQGEVHPSSQKQSESERYMEGYDMANIHRERAQRMFPAQRPHSADFLDYNAFERESDKGYGQEVMHRQRSKNHSHQNRPKSNTDQYEGEEFWSGSYPQHPPPHTPHTYAMPPVWSAKPLHHTNSPIHNRSLDSASSVPLDSLNQRENATHEYEQHTHDGYFTDKFPVVMETQYPPRPASQTRNPNNEVGQAGSPKDLQFMRSASARLPSTASQHRHEMLTGGPYSRDDLVEQDPRRVQQREESMKRLLEWKQRMLQSPLTKKYTQKGTSNSTPTIAPSKTHPPPEEYRKQVLQELANHEARVQGHSPVANVIPSKQTERMNTPDSSARNSGRPESSEENTLLSQPLRKEHELKGQPQRSSRSTSRSPSRSQAENKRVSSSLNRYHNSYSSDDEDVNVRERKRTRRPSQANKARRNSVDRNSGSKKTSSPGSKGPPSPSSSPDYVNISIINDNLSNRRSPFESQNGNDTNDHGDSKHEYVNIPVVRHDDLESVHSEHISDHNSKSEFPDMVFQGQRRRHQSQPDIFELHDSIPPPLLPRSQNIPEKNCGLSESGRHSHEQSVSNKDCKAKWETDSQQRHNNAGNQGGSEIHQRKEYKDESVQTSFPYDELTPDEFYPAIVDDKLIYFSGNTENRKYGKSPSSIQDDHSTGKYSDSGYDTLRLERSSSKNTTEIISLSVNNESPEKVHYDSEDSMFRYSSSKHKKHQPGYKISIQESGLPPPPEAKYIDRSKKPKLFESSELLNSKHCHELQQDPNFPRRKESKSLRNSKVLGHSALYERHIHQQKQQNEGAFSNSTVFPSDSKSDTGVLDKKEYSDSNVPSDFQPHKNDNKKLHDNYQHSKEKITGNENEQNVGIPVHEQHYKSEYYNRNKDNNVKSSKETYEDIPNEFANKSSDIVKKETEFQKVDNKVDEVLLLPRDKFVKEYLPQPFSNQYAVYAMNPDKSKIKIEGFQNKKTNLRDSNMPKGRSMFDEYPNEFGCSNDKKNDTVVNYKENIHEGLPFKKKDDNEHSWTRYDSGYGSRSLQNYSDDQEKNQSPLEMFAFGSKKYVGRIPDSNSDYVHDEQYWKYPSSKLKIMNEEIVKGDHCVKYESRPAIAPLLREVPEKSKLNERKNIVEFEKDIDLASQKSLKTDNCSKLASYASKMLYQERPTSDKEYSQAQAQDLHLQTEHEKSLVEISEETRISYLMSLPPLSYQYDSNFLQERPTILTEKLEKFRKQKETPPKNIVQERIRIFEAASIDQGKKPEVKQIQGKKLTGNTREQIIAQAAAKGGKDADFLSSSHKQIEHDVKPFQSQPPIWANFPPRRRFHSDTEAVLYSGYSTEESESDDERKEQKQYGHAILTPTTSLLADLRKSADSTQQESQKKSDRVSPVSLIIASSSNSLLTKSEEEKLLQSENDFSMKYMSPFYANLSEVSDNEPPKPEEYYIPMGPKSWLFGSGMKHLENSDEAVYVQMDDQGFLSRSSDTTKTSPESDNSRKGVDSANQTSPGVYCEPGNIYSDTYYDAPYKCAAGYEPIYAELKHPNSSDLDTEMKSEERNVEVSPYTFTNEEGKEKSTYEECLSYKNHSSCYENIMPDILGQESRQESHTPSSASDADDEASKDFEMPHRFSMSDSFRPASYYLKSKAFKELDRHQDSSDEDLESPPPIPLSPPPLEDLEGSEVDCSKWNAETTTPIDSDVHLSKEDTDQSLSPSSKRKPVVSSALMLESPPQSPLHSQLNYAYYRVYEDERRYTEVMFKTNKLNTTSKNPKYVLNVCNARIYDEGKHSSNRQIFPLSGARLPSTSKSEATQSIELSFSEAGDQGLSKSSCNIDKITLEKNVENQADDSGQPSNAECQEIKKCKDDSSVSYGEDNKMVNHSLQSAPYYYSDLLKDGEFSRMTSSSSERTNLHSPRGRQLLNNTRDISPTSTKRDDIGRKVNQIQSPNGLVEEISSNSEQVAQELTNSIEFLTSKKFNDIEKNMYESDTLKAQKHQLALLRSLDAEDARNLYPLGLRDKNPQTNLEFAPSRQRRSRSLEGLLDWNPPSPPPPRHERVSSVTPSHQWMPSHSHSSELESHNEPSSAISDRQSSANPFLGQRGGLVFAGGGGSDGRRDWDRMSRSLDELDVEMHFLGQGPGGCGYEGFKKRGSQPPSSHSFLGQQYYSDFEIDREKLRQWDLMSSAAILPDEDDPNKLLDADSCRMDENPDFWQQKRISKASEIELSDLPSQNEFHFLGIGPNNAPPIKNQNFSNSDHFLGKLERSDFDGGGNQTDISDLTTSVNYDSYNEKLKQIEDENLHLRHVNKQIESQNNTECNLSSMDGIAYNKNAIVLVNMNYKDHCDDATELLQDQQDFQDVQSQPLTDATSDEIQNASYQAEELKESASGSMRELKEHLLATNTLPLTRPSPLRRRSKDMIREDPNVSDSEIHVKGKSLNAKLRKFVHQNDALHGNGMQPTLSAGDLLGKTHEELILLLIQLRRTQAKLQKAIDTCRMELEGEKKLMQIDVKNKEIHCQKVEEITKQLDDYTKQFELTKPLVNLVDNMVKLGSLYGGSGSESEEPETSYHCPTPQSPTPMIEFSRQLQEQRLLQKEQLEWNQLVPDQVDLQEKLQHLYRLDKSLQEESVTLTNLQQDKEMLERALIGIRAKANENRDNAVELERLRKQQQLVEKELSKVQAQLVQTTKKLEETAAENAKIEHEIMVLRQKIQQTLKKATVVNPPVIEDVETAQLKAQLEEELSHVQGIMDELSKRRKELSGAVEQLKDSGTAEVRPSPTGVAGSAPLPGRKPHRSTYLETDLDTMETRDVLDEVYLEDKGPPTYVSHHKGKPHQVPLYVNADTIGNKAEFDSEKLPDGSAPSDYPQIIGSNDEYHYIIDKQELYAPQDINEADERMKRFYGIIPKEKPAEIKTVRIVKRESERRNKGREKKKVTYEDQFLSKVIEEPESTIFDNFEYLDDFQLTEFQRSMSLPRNYGRASYIPAHMLPPSSLPLTTGSATATTTATTTSSSSKILPNVPYYYRTPSLSANDQSLSAHERLFGTRTPSTGSSGSSSPSSTPLATPVFKSEAARQIVAETAQQFVAALEVEPGFEIDGGPSDTGSLRRRYKRRHYTISSSQPLELEAAQPKLVHARSRDDLDMERCLRAANTPDIVKSTIKKSENFDETTIDRELGLPQKIVIPERYVEQEEEEELTAEEKLHRLQKAESIRKMLSESTSYGELTGEELSTASQTLKKKYEQEKKQREQLLTLNQLLAQEVKERSKAVAARAMQNLSELKNIQEEEEDLSPVQPLPTVQQRENYLT